MSPHTVPITERPVVYVVDTDERTRQQVTAVAAKLRMDCEICPTADDFIVFDELARPSCLIAGVPPGTGGLRLQQRLWKQIMPIPYIFLAGQVVVDLAVRLMERGAFTVLVMPCTDSRLSKAITRAVSWDSECLAISRRLDQLQQCEGELTVRERKVLRLITQGAQNKRIAREMDLSVRMVETYRAQIVRKFRAKTVAEVAAKYTEFCALSNTVYRIDTPIGKRLRLSTMRRGSMSD